MFTLRLLLEQQETLASFQALSFSLQNMKCFSFSTTLLFDISKSLPVSCVPRRVGGLQCSVISESSVFLFLKSYFQNITFHDELQALRNGYLQNTIPIIHPI